VSADGFQPYVSAIENTLSDRVDFAQLIKVYRATPEGERRYSPADVVSKGSVPVLGSPDPKRICTSPCANRAFSHFKPTVPQPTAVAFIPALSFAWYHLSMKRVSGDQLFIFFAIEQPHGRYIGLRFSRGAVTSVNGPDPDHLLPAGEPKALPLDLYEIQKSLHEALGAVQDEYPEANELLHGRISFDQALVSKKSSTP
jgi:hypothetical protein